MNDTVVIDIAREAIMTSALVAGPVMLVVLLVGVVVGIFQAATSINEMTLSFVPKLIMVMLLLSLIGSWQIQLLVDFATHVFERIPDVAK
jgi:flagellar biosynthetic protein FliQ